VRWETTAAGRSGSGLSRRWWLRCDDRLVWTQSNPTFVFGPWENDEPLPKNGGGSSKTAAEVFLPVCSSSGQLLQGSLFNLPINVVDVRHPLKYPVEPIIDFLPSDRIWVHLPLGGAKP
jgi:hypothetical protein